MIYEGVFFSFDLVLSLVAVLIVPGGFKGGCLFIGPRFLPPWAELADPSPVLFEKRRVRAGDLSPWLDPRPLGWGALAWKAEILGRSPPPLPFGTQVPDCSLAGELVPAFFAGRGLLVSSSELPPKCCYFVVVGGLACLADPRGYASWSFWLLVGTTMLNRLWARGQTKCNTLLMLATSVFGRILLTTLLCDVLVKVQAGHLMAKWRGMHGSCLVPFVMLTPTILRGRVPSWLSWWLGV